MKKVLFLCFATLAINPLAALNAQTIYQLTPIPTFGSHSDGSLRSGEGPYDASFNQRGMAYDPVLTNVIVVDTHTGAGASDHGVGNIYVIDGLTGAGSFTLNTNGIGTVGPNQAYPYAPAAVADDGVVYVCNQVNNSGTTPFVVYRWENSLSTNPPTIVFSNTITPANRYGTSIDIRGAGTNTQIIIGSLANGTAGTNVVLFTTTIESVDPATNAAGTLADGTGYLANDTVAIQVYAYRTVSNSGVRVYSATAAQSTTVTSNDVFTVNWAWDATVGAQGYRLLRNVNGAGYNEYKDVTVNTNADANAGWTAGSTVTPTNGPFLRANVLATDATSPNFNEGVAFGYGDTFWAKQVNVGLRVFAFTLTNATTIRSYNSANFTDNDNLAAISVSTNLNLLVGLEQAGGNVSGGADRVRLYDISDYTNSSPVLLDVKNFTPNNQNATAPMGYVDFVGTNVYVTSINNGLMAFSVGLGTVPAPTLTTVPADTNLAVVGRTVIFSVIGFPQVSYQWKSNNVVIAGATNSSLTLVNVQTNFAAVYLCTVTNTGGSTNASTTLVVLSSSDFYHLNLQWTAYPGDGVDTTTHAYIYNGGGASGGTPNARSFAYNSLSNHLYFMTRNGFANNAGTSNYNFNVVNASNGALLYTMKTNGVVLGIGAGGVGLASVVCSDDGVIYACNMAPRAGGIDVLLNPDPTMLFRIYRWDNADSNTLPVEIYSGDPSIKAGLAGVNTVNRWGDSLAIRGTGTNTQLLLDNNNTTARYVAILTPTDATLNTWTQSVVAQTVTGSTIGRMLEYASGGTTRAGSIWQKRRATDLIKSPFDLDSPIDPIPASLTSSAFTNSVSGGTIDSAKNLFFGVSTYTTSPTPDTLDVYEISSPSSPILLAQYNFPVNFGTNHNLATPNAINKVVRSGTNLWAMDCGNGIMAFTIVPGPPTAPVFLVSPQNLRLVQGGSGTMLVSVDQQSAFQWTFNGANIAGATGQTYSITNAQFTNAGLYRVVASNIFGVTTSATATVTVFLPEDSYSLSQIWSIPPADFAPYVSTNGGTGSTPNERFIAYGTLRNQLYLSRRNAANSYSVFVIDANNPSNYYTLNTNGVYMSVPAFGGSTGAGLVGIGVADDGAVYACNLTADAGGFTNANGVFRVYRWADSDSNTVPVQIFTGDPASRPSPFRWGDVMSVRGSGMNTEILLDENGGNYAAVLKPSNASMTTFTNAPLTRFVGSGSIGRQIQFGYGNTFWQKRKGTGSTIGPLFNSSFSLTSQTTTLITNYSTFAATVGGIGLDFDRHLAAGIDFVGAGASPDKVNLYEVTDFKTPVLLASYSFPTNKNANDNFIGQTIFAGKKVFSLDANNGLIAFEIAGRELRIDGEIGSPNITLSWYTNMTTNYVLQVSPSLFPTNWTDEGSTPVIDGVKFWVTNSIGTNKFYRLRR